MESNTSFLQQYSCFTESFNALHIMTHEEDGTALALGDVFHLADGFLLELGIADGEDFVYDEDLRFEEGGYGEAQTDCHTGTITLHRGVDIAFTAGEIDDLVQLGLDLITRHAEDSAVHEDILPTRHLAMEAGANFKQRAYTAMGTDSAGRRAGDTGKELKQSGFACTVLADDADDVALLNLEVDIAERPDVLGVAFGGTVVGLADLEIRVLLAEDVGDPEAADIVAQGLGRNQTEAVLLGYVVKFYCSWHIFLKIIVIITFLKNNFRCQMLYIDNF